jgi:NADH:ubiquinone oxidoreductase subunit 4 (subunit M)
LNARELAALLPVAALCVVLGVYPQPFLNVARPDLATVSDLAHLAQVHGGTAVARNAMPAVPVQRTAVHGEVK